MKLLCGSVLAWLCLPALPARADVAKLQLDADVTAGKDVRHYKMHLVDDRCSRTTSKTKTGSDDLKVCPHIAGAQVRLDVDWTMRRQNADGSFQDSLVDTSIVIARGEHADVNIDGAKLVLALP